MSCAAESSAAGAARPRGKRPAPAAAEEEPPARRARARARTVSPSRAAPRVPAPRVPAPRVPAAYAINAPATLARMIAGYRERSPASRARFRLIHALEGAAITAVDDGYAEEEEEDEEDEEDL
jgi:hypothetical protein